MFFFFPFSLILFVDCIKNVFLSNILKTGNLVENTVLPFNVSIFREDVQSVLSMLSQILGYDDDKSVTEVMLGFLLRTNLPNPK